MILYEVTTRLNRVEDAGGWLEWMKGEHIRHVVETGCFLQATLVADTEDPCRFSVRYAAASMDDLQRYMLEFAPKLRAEFTRRFEGKAEITRRIWREEQVFTP